MVGLCGGSQRGKKERARARVRVREKERKREREKERKRQREKERKSEREKDRKRERGKEGQREREKERTRERQRERERERKRERREKESKRELVLDFSRLAELRTVRFKLLPATSTNLLIISRQEQASRTPTELTSSVAIIAVLFSEDLLLRGHCEARQGQHCGSELRRVRCLRNPHLLGTQLRYSSRSPSGPKS